MSSNERKDMRSTMKSKSKVTMLFVAINERVEGIETTRLKELISLRMGDSDSLEFEIEEVSALKSGQSSGSLITIRFESFKKACIARNMLSNSNKNADQKIRCFFKREEANGEEAATFQQREVELQKAATEIFETALAVVNDHDNKMKIVRDNIVEVSNQISKYQGDDGSFADFEKLSNEKLALEDKLEELISQKKEFKKYIDSMKTSLTEMSRDKKFDTHLKEVRKAFEIESRRLKTALPMYARREDILNVVRGNQVCVILGETGSGKSTQMVQYLFQAGLAADGLIACTQPRKIAATSLATHVSAEMGSGVGHLIGYQVGLQTKSSAKTKVIFMTDHILLNECLRDRLLKKYSCVLIDEAHERSIHTDLLLGMLKEALAHRPEMKVIITSATIDPDIFVAYFGGKDKCPVLKVSGRTFPVDVIWDPENENDNAFPEDYENKALNKAIEIHQSYTVEQGDILVFLTSAIEIERSVQKMKQRIGEKDLQCLQLHGRLTPEEQQLVFEPTPKGKRKIVFATNSAETSITIPGIKFVVDTGVVKEMKFDAKKNMNCLDVDAVSQSSANQRKGRAGRMASGICYRLYSESDFTKMEKTSNPEILRIQVSQALLKLLELGVDPLNFQYVQSPTPASMKSAMSELRNIGAVEGTRLTELGKWIARMPVEPRLGVFIKKGLDQDIALEALVLASCCNQSGIFFRAGSQEEKKTADLKKVKFCHPGGDLLTMLNVYRDWIQVKDKEKGKWCQNNSINGKAMKGIQEMVKEISSTLKKEMNITLKHSFKSPEVADVLIQKLIFECMKENVGYYLGHENAGYLIVNRHQRVQLHPSSAILSLGIQPNWVVFNRVLKTSADYMTEVTPVPDEMVEEAIKNRSLAVDKEALVNEKVSRVLKLFTGKDVFYKFVGPMHKNRRRMEEEIGQACQGALTIIEADKQRGEVNLFSQPKHTELASAMLRSSLEDVSEYLLRETREECIGNEHSGFRALLREGGAAVDVLMPNQYRSCSILQKSTLGNCDMDEDKIKIILEMSGPVEQIWRPKGKKTSKFWGKVIFVNAADAVSATNRINNDSECGICLEAVNSTEKPKPSFLQEYTMKVTWCRRPAKGHCFITTEQKEDAPLLLGKSLSIRGLSVSIQNSKQQSNLYVKGLPVNITEEEIKEGLARALDRPLETCKSRFRVVIPRGNIFSGSDEKQRTQTQLTSLTERYTGPDTFRVNMRDIQPKSVTGCAFISFTDLDVCCNTGEAFQRDNAAIFGAKIEVSMEFKSSVYIKKPLYHLIKKDLERVVDACKMENSSTVIGVREMKSGHVSVEIKATSTQQLATEKAKVDKIVGGDEYECGDRPNFQRLFSWECKQMLRDAGKSFETLILLDHRRMKVTIQGLEENRKRTWAMIEEYMSRTNDVLETEVHLGGNDIPPGMIKVLLLKYGLKFEELKKETGISMIQLNLRGHEITIKGKESEVKLALDKIRDLREEMTQGSASAPESEAPDCPICLCPVEDSEIYRLEYCGHTYCKVCVATLVTDAVTERKLPVVCAHEECGKPLVIRDINFQIKIETITIKGLLDSALACLTTKENDRFKFCLTPDCDGVYRVSTKGEQFTCPLCHSRICTTCHLQYHDGLTCEMYQDAVKRRDAEKDATGKDDHDSMKKWLDENPAVRKLCPKCSAGIEKDGGCNHMTCRCGAHICWKCLEYFSSSGECYKHLSAKHGGCFDY